MDPRAIRQDDALQFSIASRARFVDRSLEILSENSLVVVTQRHQAIPNIIMFSLGEPWRILVASFRFIPLSDCSFPTALACVTSFFVKVIMLKSSYWSYFTLKALGCLRHVIFSRPVMHASTTVNALRSFGPLVLRYLTRHIMIACLSCSKHLLARFHSPSPNLPLEICRRQFSAHHGKHNTPSPGQDDSD